MPDLLTLGALKAFALGRRSKWKDYLDLYFILKFHFSFKEVSNKAKEILNDEFIEKQFIAQLGYFAGINHEEEVIFLIPNPPTEDEIKKFLTDISLSGLED